MGMGWEGLWDIVWYHRAMSGWTSWPLQIQSPISLYIRLDILSWDLVKTQSREIGSLNYCMALKFDRHIGSNAADAPVKFQSDWTVLNTNLAALRLHKILQKDALLDIETGLWFSSTSICADWPIDVDVAMTLNVWFWSALFRIVPWAGAVKLLSGQVNATEPC